MKFQNVRGTRDIVFEDAKLFLEIIDIVRKCFEKYGFSPFITPSIESFELLSIKGGLGEHVRDEIYYFKDKAGREIGLRFDLTMPLVRVVASNPQIPKPIKRYQIATVWRYDEPQRLRYREFWQADIDIVGSESLISDAECIACICETLENLNIKDFFIRVNDREALDKKLEEIGVKKKKEVMQILDKMDKIGKENVEKEIEKLGEKLKIEDLEKIETSEKINKLLEYCSYFGVDKKLKIDPYLVRGLDYYTSLVYEISFGEKISFGGGGRYDNLIENVSGTKLPATGISLGLTRIFDFIKERKIRKREREGIYVCFPKEEFIKSSLKVAEILRKKGFNVSLEVKPRKLDEQIRYADINGFRYVIIVGKEFEEGKVVVKDLETGKEKIEKLDEIF